jgi:F-type H+-transporting ATPase subunit delta
MMIDEKIICNYAVALYENVKNSKHADEALEQVSFISAIMQQDAQVRSIFCSPVISLILKQKALTVLAKQIKISKTVNNFLEILLSNSRFELLPVITEYFIKLHKEAKGIKVAEVMSFEKLQNKDLDKIKQLLHDKLGKDIELNNVVDESIMGGVVIKYDSTMIDCSIKGALEKIERVAKRSGL